MYRKLCLAAMGAGLLWLAGCASGPGYNAVSDSFPTIGPDRGRIYFLRSGSMFGAAIQPEIHLNGLVVGRSQPGGFFFVDEPPGKYIVSTTTEVTEKIEFDLAAGQTRYVRTSTDIGFLVGHITPSLDYPDKAVAELHELHYTGAVSAEGATVSQAPVESPVNPGATGPQGSEVRRATTPGTAVLLGTHARLTNDCRSRSMPEIEVRQLPAHGHLDVREGDFVVSATQQCAGTNAHGTLVYYVPEATFQGIDTVRYVSSGAPNVVKDVTIDVSAAPASQ